jgi:DNA modification methylase
MGLMRPMGLKFVCFVCFVVIFNLRFEMIKTYFETKNGKLYNGDCLDLLKQLPENSIDWCITSPPYWGLRDYGVDGQLGNETTPQEYVDKVVLIFREVKRIMADDGVLWLNLGDSYAGRGKGGQSDEKKSENWQPEYPSMAIVPNGLKPKDLVGIPWMVGFALRADGWYLRQENIWHKPNPMPESVIDRCTKSHESMFLLSKSANYYFDYKAIQEPANYDGRKETQMKGSSKYAPGDHIPKNNANSLHVAGRPHERWRLNEEGQRIRNKRSVWTVNTKPNKEAHFATYPEELILPCVKTSKPNAIILDPFMGSGTTAIVSEKFGRRWIGVELNINYCSIASRLIKDASRQFSLFEN